MMADGEKVIRGLECCSSMIPYCSTNTCPYYDVQVNCRATLERDALELLKSQEPKKRESKAMLPCKCGCKRREHWFGGDDPEKFEMLKCSHCGFTAYGKNATDVIRNWNKAVRADG